MDNFRVWVKTEMRKHCVPGMYRAFMNQSRELQEQAIKMMETARDLNATKDEVDGALETLFDILYPKGAGDAQ